MATHTDRIMVVSPSGVPSRVGAEDTIELSSGNLKVGGDLTVNGEVNIASQEQLNISASDVNISAGENAIGLDASTDTIEVDATGDFGVVAESSKFMFKDNNNSAFLVEDNAGTDYFKIVTTDSSEEVVFGNTSTTPDFNFVGGGKIIFTSFQAAEEITAGQSICLTSSTQVGVATASNLAKAHIVGIAVENCSINNLVKIVAIPGSKVSISNNLGNPNPGEIVYLSENAGQVSTTAPTASGSTVFKAGYVLDSSTILFQPQFIKINS
jgi:hypothetical protein